MNITIGPGAAIGRYCQINSHTAIGPTHVIPDHHILLPAEPQPTAGALAGRRGPQGRPVGRRRPVPDATLPAGSSRRRL
ncbi:hypothetical protein [Streptomyces sp. CL12-4]|uniref:hypothetical protein n=1 Tax=Streptomyces sp. CL12-4 TaxID=2810306 RepID=UPI001EFC2D0B|nr:hypothetical protein [Streptomyces sp. CL12-4]MCG8971465.1 hypothetical protein [Streptomyces sp. CL12-4]